MEASFQWVPIDGAHDAWAAQPGQMLRSTLRAHGSHRGTPHEFAFRRVPAARKRPSAALIRPGPRVGYVPGLRQESSGRPVHGKPVMSRAPRRYVTYDQAQMIITTRRVLNPMRDPM